MGISVEGASKRFGHFKALNDVSIDVPDGVSIGLLEVLESRQRRRERHDRDPAR